MGAFQRAARATSAVLGEAETWRTTLSVLVAHAVLVAPSAGGSSGDEARIIPPLDRPQPDEPLYPWWT